METEINQLQLLPSPRGRVNIRFLVDLGRTAESYSTPDGVTAIGDYAFSPCKSLKEVIIGDSVVTIGNDAFRSSTIQRIEIGNNVQSIEDFAFYYCILLTDVILGDINDDGTLNIEDVIALFRYSMMPDLYPIA